MNGLTHIDTTAHPIEEPGYAHAIRDRLVRDGIVILRAFVEPSSIARIASESSGREHEAFFTSLTHNVYLTPPDPRFPADHVFNRQVSSSKGCLADDQVELDSPLRDIYDDPDFRAFLCAVLEIEHLHPYADSLSSINVHFHQDGQELGWHFDNSEFAVTLLVQAPLTGGRFEYVPELRDAESGEFGFEAVEAALDGHGDVHSIEIEPGDLVVFRGRNSLHRVTPSGGDRTRMLVVFAYNTEPGISLSDSAKETFYGRLG